LFGATKHAIYGKRFILRDMDFDGGRIERSATTGSGQWSSLDTVAVAQCVRSGSQSSKTKTVVTSEIKLKRNCFISVSFQM